MQEQQLERLGLLIDELDSLAHGLKLPMPPHMHVEALAIALPEKVKKLKELYVEATGENPWE